MNGTRILASRGMHAASGNFYVGLLEYEDMAFVFHLLRRQDTFVDVGANLGTYTLGAASVGASVIAIEPIPDTVARLRANVRLNEFDSLVEIVAEGAGGESAELQFSSGGDTTNHVAVSTADRGELIQVRVTPLDEMVSVPPTVLKIDVEGYESEVLRGASQILSDEGLLSVVLELNGLGRRYGTRDIDAHGLLVGYGFQAVRYDPATRALDPIGMPRPSGNTIYVRRLSVVAERLRSAPPLQVLGVLL